MNIINFLNENMLNEINTPVSIFLFSIVIAIIAFTLLWFVVPLISGKKSHHFFTSFFIGIYFFIAFYTQLIHLHMADKAGFVSFMDFVKDILSVIEIPIIFMLLQDIFNESRK